MSCKKLVVIHGATGVGKTKCAIEVAQVLSCEIVNADSRQIYSEMSIGTAVPSPDELAAVKHHLVQSHSVEAPISAGQYEDIALKVLDNLFQTNDYVVLVGGSGMYINALLYGMDEMPSDDLLKADLNSKSTDEIGEMMLKLDPKYYNIIDKANRHRLIRALEVCIITGKPYSEQRTGERKKRNFDFIQFGLDRPRPELYNRINQRVDIMIALGLENEARSVEKFKHLSAMQTVGYREFFDYFDGKTSVEEAVELIKRNSRRYAKRQYTWMRSIEDLIWVDANDSCKIVNSL